MKVLNSKLLKAKDRNSKRDIRKELKTLANEERKLQQLAVTVVLKNTDAVLTTLTGASSKKLNGITFDLVVIDEAAQALEVQCWIALLKVLVELAELQHRDVGNETTSVVVIAAELLKRGNDLVKNKIHPTSIISRYRLAMREPCKYVEEKLAVKVDKLGKDSLINSAKTSMYSKLFNSDSDFFTTLIVDAVQAVKSTNAKGEVKYPIKVIAILKSKQLTMSLPFYHLLLDDM